MRIQTGKGTTISVLSWAAIISVSLLINLPGLAVSPMLDQLQEYFHTSESRVQLLTSLPNYLIIPFILLSGKLSVSRHKKAIIALGLVIFTASSVLYLFANSMMELLIYSCTLGIGCGLLIPFATGLIADTFAGQERTRQLGLSSALSNLILVAATFVVGILATHGWHMPFLVYLICLIPLGLIFFLPSDSKTSREDAQLNSDVVRAPQISAPGERQWHGFFVGRTLGVTAVYFFMCFLNGAVIYFLEFLMVRENIPNATVAYGTITSLFYLAIFIPGFFLNRTLSIFKDKTYLVCAISMLVGISVIILFHNVWCIGLGIVLMGFSYGVYQPVTFDKATAIVSSPRLATLALSIVMTANYVAVAVAPSIINGLRSLAGIRPGNILYDMFPFLLDLVFMAIFFLIYLRNRNSFSLSTDSQQ